MTACLPSRVLQARRRASRLVLRLQDAARLEDYFSLAMPY
jgi:hypothetical protein